VQQTNWRKNEDNRGAKEVEEARAQRKKRGWMDGWMDVVPAVGERCERWEM